MTILSLLVASRGARQDAVLVQKLVDDTHRLEVFLQRESPVIAAGNRVQLIRDTRFLQGLM